MKKRFLTLILSVVLVSSSLFAWDLPDDIEVNECMNDVFYINDMYVLRNEAQRHSTTLEVAILLDKYNGNKELMDDVVHFEPLYNYSAKEHFKDTSVAMIFDLFEGWNQAWEVNNWLTVMNALRSALMKDFILKKIPFVRELKGELTIYFMRYVYQKEIAEFLADAAIEGGLDTIIDTATIELADYDHEKVHDDDVKTMADKYQKSLLSGHGVIFVTFGQGNLFSVKTFEWLKRDTDSGHQFKIDKYMNKKTHHINIASMIYNGDGFPNQQTVMLDNDRSLVWIPKTLRPKKTHRNSVRFVVNEIIDTEPTVADLLYKWRVIPPEDKNNPSGYWIDGAIPYVHTLVTKLNNSMIDYTLTIQPSFADSFSFHSFEYYMGLKSVSAFDGHGNVTVSSQQTREAILELISNSIDTHDKTRSQWEPLSKQNKDDMAVCENELFSDLRNNIDYNMFLRKGPFYVFNSTNSSVNNKVFQIGNQTVIGQCGAKRIEQPSNSINCYVLSDENGEVVGGISHRYCSVRINVEEMKCMAYRQNCVNTRIATVPELFYPDVWTRNFYATEDYGYVVNSHYNWMVGSPFLDMNSSCKKGIFPVYAHHTSSGGYRDAIAAGFIEPYSVRNLFGFYITIGYKDEIYAQHHYTNYDGEKVGAPPHGSIRDMSVKAEIIINEKGEISFTPIVETLYPYYFYNQ